MYRRRRPRRESTFSFDSFLDLVTNVVGIIIRMIIVVWVGARAYTGFVESEPPPLPAMPPLPARVQVDLPEITDPLEQELARQRQELEKTRALLLDQLRQLDLLHADRRQAEEELARVEPRRRELDLALAHALPADRQGPNVSLAEIEERRRKLAAEVAAIERSSSEVRTLAYRAPVAEPVHSEEWHFECRAGRVAFLDLATLRNELIRAMPEIERSLRNQWEVTAATEPAGPFRLRYTMARQRDTAEALFPGAAPSNNFGFGYGLKQWVVESVAPIHGEEAAAALTAGSEFRQIIDGLPSDQAVVTLWVYPDSFDLFRQLRNFLADRNLTIACRPLPFGQPITGSPAGSRSRGQ